MAEEKKKGDKKIISDEDWKEQAKKEKEVLAAQEKAEKEKRKGPERRGPLPKGDFAALLSMLVTQALFSMGVLAVEGEEGKREPDLALAKYNIDMLETLEEKTKGNLSEQEEKALTNMLNQVRMAYVEVSEKKE
jgi:hypothetical protein